MPEISSVNNTTPLSEGNGVGMHNFQNYTSRMIDAQVSRGNYQAGIKDDAQLKQFRDIVYKMVSTWLYEDKIRIVSEYGDSELLKKNPKEKDLNAICTESLIIHLPKADLQKLVAEVRVKENRLKKDIQKAQNNREKVAKTAFNPKSWQEMMSEKSNGQNIKGLLKDIKNTDKEYKIPSDIKRQFSRLANELRDVIKECYNKIMLANLGQRMGLDLDVKEKELTTSIVNKTILYVALVTGKSKNELLSNAISDPDPYNELLRFTSYSYITGEPAMDMNAWRELRNNARQAKAAIKILSNMQRKRKNRFSSAFKSISGGNTSASQIAANDTGILKDATTEDLIMLAGRYGIDIKKTDIGKLKFQLYRAMAANKAAMGNAQARIDAAARNGRLPNQADVDAVKIRSSGVFSKAATSGAADEVGTPIVKFSRTGDRLDQFILRAVPVYVVGNGQRALASSPLAPQNAGRITDIHGVVVGNRLDTKIDRKAELSPDSLQKVQYIMTLTDLDLTEFESKILVYKYFVSQDIINANVQRSTYMRRAYDIWLYGEAANQKDMSKYAVEHMGVKPYANYKQAGIVRAAKTVWHGMKKFGLGVAAVARSLALVTPIRRIKHGVNLRKQMKNGGVKKFEDLPEEAQQYYYAESQKIKQMGLEAYANTNLQGFAQSTENKKGRTTLGISREALADADIIDTIQIRDIYIMLKASKNGQLLLASYLESKTGYKVKDFKFSGNLLKNIKNFFTAPMRALKATFGKKGKKGRTALSNDGTAQNQIATLESSTGTPLVKVTAEGEVESEISMAVPVFIVGKSHNKSDKEDKASHDNTTGNIEQSNALFGNYNVSAHGENAIAISFGTTLQRKSKNEMDVTAYESAAANALGIKSTISRISLPTYVINSELSTIKSNSDYLPIISSALSVLVDGLKMDTIAGTAGPFPVAATVQRLGLTVGTLSNEIKSAASAASDTVSALASAKSPVHMAATGATKISRFATGGTAAITGDAIGSDIFAHGAKPELVRSTGDMSVTPLNKAGTSTKQNITRMTLSQRSSALASAITSHVVKLSYSLPSGAQDISNPGEAIKVYNVKPGITDSIDIGNGSSTSLIGLVASIYSQLAAITGLSQTSGQLLTTIAANTSKIGSISSGTTGGNPFAGGFPSSLDGILSGE